MIQIGLVRSKSTTSYFLPNTNGCVADSTIRSVSEKSSIEPVSEKYIIDDNVTIDKKQNNNDIQGSEEENNQQKLQPTTNTVFWQITEQTILDLERWRT